MMMLVVMHGATFTFSSCSKDSDDPEEEVAQSVISLSSVYGHWSDDSYSYYDTYSIRKNKQFLYEHMTDDIDLLAEGTYTINGTELVVDYTYVLLDGASSYDGFAEGKNCQKKYTIISCDGKKMTLKTPNGKQVSLTKYADVED